MCDEEPEDQNEDRPEIEEVVSDFDGGIRVRSGFQIEEVDPGVVGINIFGPVFELLDDEDGDELDEDVEEDHEQPET